MPLLGRALNSIVAFALPPRCASCGQIVRDDFELCASCWASLDFHTGPGCATCGVPVSEIHAICAPCLEHPPDHDGAYAAVSYGEVARSIALKFKHGRRIGLARLMARLMIPRLPGEPGVFVPVPLHRRRIWSRGFNQSALIAQHMGRSTGMPVELDLLKRTKATPMLGGLGASERVKAVRGVFSTDAALHRSVDGSTVYLVDDVYTSGATTNACARVLKRAGAQKVKIICWARVLQGEALH